VSDLWAPQTKGAILAAARRVLAATACVLLLSASGIYSEQRVLTAASEASVAVRLHTQGASRLASSRIPAGVHEVQITRARHGQAPSLSITLTSPATVQRTIAMIDRLPTVQPGTGVFACPAIPVNPPVVTLTFRASTAGPVLAQASQAVDATAGAPCQAMSLSIRGRSEPSLAGGPAFLRRLGRLIGVTLVPMS
jgi:hypothetical protein